MEGLDEASAQAFREAKWCFTDEEFPNITNSFLCHRLPNTIGRIFAENSGNGETQSSRSTPDSTTDFLERAKCVFSAPFLRHLGAKFDAFDSLCGDSLAGGFLSAKSYEAWAAVFAENTLHYYLEAPARKSHEPGPIAAGKRMPIPQFDGTGDEPTPPAPMRQIVLKGKTIKEAWHQNEDIRRMTGFERLPNQNWTPSVPGGAPVFHGTSRHLRSADGEANIDLAFSQNPTKLERVPGLTQLYPATPDLAGIFTSFSALRSFLWAVFVGDVIRDPPGPSHATVLDKPFRMRDQPYRGVLLAQFHSTQPAPSGISWYQIPVGKEDAWRWALVNPEPRHPRTSEGWWKVGLGVLHGQDTADFPDLVHGKDLPSLRQCLGPFPCNRAFLWQSAWISDKSALALQKKISEIYAISFEREEEQPETTSGKKESAFRTFGRKLGKKFTGKKGGKQ